MSEPADRSAGLEDERARREALAPTRSLLLQAPAGSGKTTVLTARFLALLAVVDAPEEILAITFTRKAAAEMRHRVLAALQAAANGETVRGIDAATLAGAHARDRERHWELLRAPSRLRIETIDALNYSLARQLPIAARAGARLTLTVTPDPLYQRAARASLRETLQEGAAAAHAAHTLLERLDNNWRRLELLLAQMLSRRSHWLPRVLGARELGLVERVQQSLQSVLRGELAAALVRLTAVLVQEGAQLLAHLDGSAFTPLSAEPVDLPRWRRLAALALTDKGWRQRITVREGFAKDDEAGKQRAREWIEALSRQTAAEETLRLIATLPDAIFLDEDRAALEALSQLLTRAAAELQLVFAEQGVVDYAYVATAARTALTEDGAPSDLALRAGSALRHILVDEFQDTSYEQFELLQALTAAWEHGDGRSLFLVGDPMQSIYQFREAEVGLFLRARDHGLGTQQFEALQLRRNFRSSAAIIDWVNTQFARLFPAEDDARLAAVRYLPSIAGLPPSASTQEPAVSLHRFEHSERAPREEAARVVQIVATARARAPAATVAVLVASRDHAAAIVAALNEAGFACRGVDLQRLRERPVIRDLSALTRVLLHRADRSAWLALLRAPWCGWTLAELETQLPAGVSDLYAALATVGLEGASAQRLARLRAALEPAMQGEERGAPLWQRVERSWLRLGGAAIYRDEVDRLDALRYLDALALHEDPETLVGEALEELTERLFSSSPPQPGAIDVMTMHAAKGLEWDVVILPGLGRRTARDNDPLLHWIELPHTAGDPELLMAPIRGGERESKSSVASYVKRLRRERSRLERVRLLYVAATRARQRLHLLGTLSSLTPDAPELPASGSLLSILWPVIGEQFAAVSLIAAEPAAPVEAGVQALLWRLPAEWQLPAPPASPPVQRLRLTATDPIEAPEYSWVGQTARAVGTIVHSELRRLTESPLPRAGEFMTHPPDYTTWLAELGVDLAERVSAQARIHEALTRTLEDERGRWLLDHTHREASSEWRLTGVYEGRLVNVIFDRMFIADGQRWIIDYKTSTHEGGAIEEFLDAEATRYRPQLQRYAALAAHLSAEPVRVALYFPLLGTFREVR